MLDHQPEPRGRTLLLARKPNWIFTTETASASSGGHSVQVTGVRIVPAVRYTQLVGATVNKPNAVPEPGTAVYTVLSGSFDRLP